MGGFSCGGASERGCRFGYCGTWIIGVRENHEDEFSDVWEPGFEIHTVRDTFLQNEIHPKLTSLLTQCLPVVSETLRTHGSSVKMEKMYQYEMSLLKREVKTTILFSVSLTCSVLILGM